MLLGCTREVEVRGSHAAFGVRQFVVVRGRFHDSSGNLLDVLENLVVLLGRDKLLGELVLGVRNDGLPVAVRALLKQLAGGRPRRPVAVRLFHGQTGPVALPETRSVQLALSHCAG